MSGLFRSSYSSKFESELHRQSSQNSVVGAYFCINGQFRMHSSEARTTHRIAEGLWGEFPGGRPRRFELFSCGGTSRSPCRFHDDREYRVRRSFLRSHTCCRRTTSEFVAQVYKCRILSDLAFQNLHNSPAAPAPSFNPVRLRRPHRCVKAIVLKRLHATSVLSS